jgi:hypothetical protein
MSKRRVLYIPVGYVCADGYKLGEVYSRIRRGWPISAAQRKQLDAMGADFTVRSRATNWWDRFKPALKLYVEEFGHAKVPARYSTVDGYNLGAQCCDIRSGKCALTAEQTRQIIELGFDLTPKENWWEKFCTRFVAYVQETGSTDVPARFVCGDGYKLGKVCVNQIRHRRSRLSSEQKIWLDDNAFQWETGRKRVTPDDVTNLFTLADYVVDVSAFSTVASKLNVVCPEKHQYRTSYTEFRVGHRCPVCCGNQKVDADEVRKRFTAQKYTPSLDTYTNTHTPVRCICPIGHTCNISLHNLESGHGCSVCWKEKRKKEAKSWQAE